MVPSTLPSWLSLLFLVGPLPTLLPTPCRFPGICGRRGAQPRAHAQHTGEQHPQRGSGRRSRAAHTFRHLCWFSFREGERGQQMGLQASLVGGGAAEPTLGPNCLCGRVESAEPPLVQASVEGGGLLNQRVCRFLHTEPPLPCCRKRTTPPSCHLE